VQVFTVFALCGLTFVYLRNRWIHKSYSLVEDFDSIVLDATTSPKASEAGATFDHDQQTIAAHQSEEDQEAAIN